MEIPYAAKYPILLPRSDPLTSLIVKLTNASATTESVDVSDSVNTRLCDWVVFSSKAHSLGMDCTLLTVLGSKPACSHSGPILQSWLTDSSSDIKPLVGRSAGLEEPRQWLQRSGWTLRQISVTLLLAESCQ